ncbi:MAG TPA: serine hydrolase domain-containing protein [Polyangiaceae bacterium]|nr:serine hydrolase domain-containing protein [Polyangiaceae bacterium]
MGSSSFLRVRRMVPSGVVPVRQRRVCHILAALPAVVLGVNLQHAAAIETGRSAAMYARLDEYLTAQLERARIPGAALVVVEADRIAHVASFGSAGPSGERITPQTPFSVGSVSKSFTALAALQLMEQGLLDLDASVQRYLPWLEVTERGGAAPITIRHLLSHTSGLSTRSGRRIQGDETLTQAVSNLARFELVAAPGERFEYSNSNYQVLGAVIEAITGTAFADTIEHGVFEPLDLRHAHTRDSSAVADHLASGHRYWFGWPVAEDRGPSAVSAVPSGGLMLSAEDLGRYLLAWLNGGTLGGSRVLSPGSVDLAFQPVARVPRGGEYGLGWQLKLSESFGIWHAGSTSGFHAHVALDRASRRGFALLLNAESYVSGPAIGKLGVEVGRALSGEAPVPIGGPGIPLALGGLMLFVALQALFCVRAVIALSKSRRAAPPPAAAALRHLTVSILLAIALSLTALVGLPESNDIGWLGLVHAAPDAGWLLLAIAVQAVLYAMLRVPVWLRAQRPTP